MDNEQPTIKSPAEIAKIKEGGQILTGILAEVLDMAKEGVTTKQLDELAEKRILQSGGVPSFKNYRTSDSEPPFPSTICASINNELVHTPAKKVPLKDGDILTVDIGMRYPADNGFYTDMAKTIGIGNISDQAKKLLAVTEKSLELGIAQVKAGNKVSDISRAVQEYVEANGFSVVRRLTGHGVGYEVHEAPRVPNFVDKRFGEVKLKAGMVICIEPMVNVGTEEIDVLPDGWTIVTADGTLSAHFEHTIAVTNSGYDILTK